MTADINRLAETLMASKLAASPSEAERMAKEMLGVAEKVAADEKKQHHYSINGYTPRTTEPSPPPAESRDEPQEDSRSELRGEARDGPQGESQSEPQGRAESEFTQESSDPQSEEPQQAAELVSTAPTDDDVGVEIESFTGDEQPQQAAPTTPQEQPEDRFATQFEGKSVADMAAEPSQRPIDTESVTRQESSSQFDIPDAKPENPGAETSSQFDFTETETSPEEPTTQQESSSQFDSPQAAETLSNEASEEPTTAQESSSQFDVAEKEPESSGTTEWDAPQTSDNDVREPSDFLNLRSDEQQPEPSPQQQQSLESTPPQPEQQESKPEPPQEEEKPQRPKQAEDDVDLSQIFKFSN